MLHHLLNHCLVLVLLALPLSAANACVDLDADGFGVGCPAGLDCADDNSQINPAVVDICGDGIDQNCNNNIDDLLVSATGELYCQQMNVPSLNYLETGFVEVLAYADRGVHLISLRQDINNSSSQTFLCGGASTCRHYFPVTPQFIGPLYLTSELYSGNLTLGIQYLNQAAWQGTIGCKLDYCPPETSIKEFISWMRAVNYPECLVSKYLDFFLDAHAKAINIQLLSQRSRLVPNPFVLRIYDIVPTDPEATFNGIGLGEGNLCQTANTTTPPFCPNPVPSDYRLLESHFESTFGIDFIVEYHRVPISYLSELGAPVLKTYAIGMNTYSYYQFPSGYLTAYSANYPAHSIVHYAASTWLGLPIADMTGGGSSVSISLEPWNLLGVTTYSHEFGHSFGLPHSFYKPPASASALTATGLDGIMSNTYPVSGISSGLLDPMDPMERYVFEPDLGNPYNDAPTFANTYAGALIGAGKPIPSCMFPDLALESPQLIPSNLGLTIQVPVRNLGSLKTGYVELQLLDGGIGGRVIETRDLWLVLGQSLQTQKFDVTCGLSSGTVTAVIDPSGLIDETNETNNVASSAAPVQNHCPTPAATVTPTPTLTPFAPATPKPTPLATATPLPVFTPPPQPSTTPTPGEPPLSPTLIQSVKKSFSKLDGNLKAISAKKSPKASKLKKLRFTCYDLTRSMRATLLRYPQLSQVFSHMNKPRLDKLWGKVQGFKKQNISKSTLKKLAKAARSDLKPIMLQIT